MSDAVPSIVRDEPDADEQDRVDAVRLASGDDAALNDLMNRHGGKLMNYLIRCLQDENLAADLAQETFVRVYQHRNTFDARQKFSTWLYAIASNLVRDQYRWRARHPQVSLEAKGDDTTGSLAETWPESKLSPDQELQAAERADVVRRAVADLTEEIRVPLILAEYEDKSQAEIGEILGCSAKAVETRIYRARQILRVKLNKLIGE